MSQALYRKWRPQKWDEVVAQEHVVQTLRNAVRTGRTGHAYLLAGPRGTGKTTTARLLAKALNCLAEDTAQRPCDECEHCTSINAGRFLDLIEIDAASNTSVDDVRALRDKINFSPTQGRYKVYIIDEVHMLSTAAFNALLKTLEEPPPHAIFILATTEIYKIPATVLSRCQRYEFRRIPVSDMVLHLREKADAEGLSVEDEALTLIARQATGAMRDAISLLDQLSSTGSRVTLAEAQEVLGTATSAMVVALIDALLARDAANGLQMVQSALDAGTDARQFARQVVDYLRSVLLVRMGNSDAVDTTAEMRAALARHAQGFDTARLLESIRLFNNAATDTRSSWHPGLGIELALAESMEEKAPAAAQPPAASTQPAAVQASAEMPAARPGVDQARINAARAAAATPPTATGSSATPAPSTATGAVREPPLRGTDKPSPAPGVQTPPSTTGGSSVPVGARRDAPTHAPGDSRAGAQTQTPSIPGSSATNNQSTATGAVREPPLRGTDKTDKPSSVGARRDAPTPAPGDPRAGAQTPPATTGRSAQPEPVNEPDDMPEMPPFDPSDDEFYGGPPAGSAPPGPVRTYDRSPAQGGTRPQGQPPAGAGRGAKPSTPPAAGPSQATGSSKASGAVREPPLRETDKPSPAGDSSVPVGARRDAPTPTAGDSRPGAKPATPTTSDPSATAGRTVTQQEVTQNWPRVLQMVKSKNKLSVAALNSCRSVVVKENTLILGFQSAVVKSKMETAENIELLRQALQAILGANLNIRCTVTSSKGPTAGDANVDGDGMVGTALDLGGKIVYEE